MYFNFDFNQRNFQADIHRSVTNTIPRGESLTVAISPDALYGIISLQVEPLDPKESFVVVTDIRQGLGSLDVTVRNFHKLQDQIVAFRTVQIPTS